VLNFTRDEMNEREGKVLGFLPYFLTQTRGLF
jgi:hypothetical protein